MKKLFLNALITASICNLVGILSQNNDFSNLPQEIISGEIIKNQLILPLAKTCLDSLSPNKVEKFFRQIRAITSTNKYFYNMINSYIPVNKPQLFPVYYDNCPQLLILAIENNWDKFAKDIIESINLSQDSKDMALKWAAINKKTDLVGILLRKKADPSKAVICMSTWDTYCAINVVETLNKDINTTLSRSDINLENALKLGIQSGSVFPKWDIASIKYLLNGATQVIKDEALVLAVNKKRVNKDVIKLLLQSGANVNTDMQKKISNLMSPKKRNAKKNQNTLFCEI